MISMVKTSYLFYINKTEREIFIKFEYDYHSQYLAMHSALMFYYLIHSQGKAKCKSQNYKSRRNDEKKFENCFCNDFFLELLKVKNGVYFFNKL